MKIEASGTKGPVSVVAIRGFEIAHAIKLRSVPQPTSQIGKQRKLRPQERDLTDEHRVVVVNGAKRVVERSLSPLYCSCHLVYALHFLLLRISHLGIWYIQSSATLLRSWISPLLHSSNNQTRQPQEGMSEREREVSRSLSLSNPKS